MVIDLREKIKKEIVLPEAVIRLRSDGIVHVTFKKNVTLDVPLQMRMLDHFLDITDGKKMPFVYNAMEGVIVTQEARENAITIQDRAPVLAIAIIADNLAYRMIANFYMKVNKPKNPFRVFSKMPDAIKWLEQFKK